MLPMKKSSAVLVDLSICEDNKEEVIVDLERVFNESSPINVHSRFQFAAEAVSAVDNLHGTTHAIDGVLSCLTCHHQTVFDTTQSLHSHCLLIVTWFVNTRAKSASAI